MLVGIPVMLPVAMLAVGPVLAIQALYDNFFPNGCIQKSGLALLGVIVGLIGDPFVWIGCIVYFTPKGIIRLRDWYRSRR